MERRRWEGGPGSLAVAGNGHSPVTGIGVLVLGYGGAILDASPNACRLLGRTREKVLVARLDDVLDLCDSGCIAVVLGKSGERGAEIEASLAERIRDEETEKRRFRAAFEMAPVGAAHVAPDGRWLWANERLLKIVGYSREELLARTFQDITHRSDLDVDLEQGKRLLSGEIDAFSMEKRYLHKDGSVVWVALKVSLVRKLSGEADFFTSVVEDITERKLKELVPDPLKPGEMDVLRLVASGRTNRQISRELRYSVGNIKHRVQSILKKLGTGDRNEAVEKAVDIGLVLPPN